MEFVDYKCLESLLIEGEEMIATEATEDYQKIKVNFFNKVWNNVKVSIRKNVNIEEANKQIDMFVKNSAKLSKEIESEFCQACYDTMYMWNDDMYPIKKYSDIKPDSHYSWANLQINYIIATDMYDRKNKCSSGKVGLIICGEWPADPEHGWCFGYHDGKWNHDIREFDNCLDLF